MKKKIVSLLCASALALSMSVPAFAEGVETTGTFTSAKSSSQETTVKTDVVVKYTVTIPTSISVTSGVTDTPFDVTVSDAVLNPDGKVVVKTTATGTLKNDKKQDATIAYTIQDATEGALDDTPLSTFSFNADGTQKCKVNITAEAWKKAKAGSYSDTITFAISYDNGIPAAPVEGSDSL